MKTFVALIAVACVVVSTHGHHRYCKTADFTGEPAVTDAECSVRPGNEPLCSANPRRSTKIIEEFMHHQHRMDDVYMLGAGTVDGVITYWCEKENITMEKINGRHHFVDYFENDVWIYDELCTGSYENWYVKPNASNCFHEHWERFVMHSNYDVYTGDQVHDHKINWFVSVECRRDHGYETQFLLRTTCLSNINDAVKKWIAENISRLDVDQALQKCF